MRPLEPPPGYEHYYSMEEMFPTRKEPGSPPKNFWEWLERVRFALRLYKHYYFPDPELTKIENMLFREEEVAITKDDIDKAVQHVRTAVQESTKDVDKYKRQVEKVVDDFTDNVQETIKQNRPLAEQVFNNRMDVFKASMAEFSTGYKEGLDGSLQWMKIFDTDEEENLDAFKSHPDNRPIRYEVQEPPLQKSEES